MPVGEKQTLRFGPFLLDTQCGQLRKNGVGLKLQGQPVQILELLLEKPGQLVTREEIRQRLWSSDTFVDFDHSIDTAVKKLRQALGDEADTPRYIETLPKRGYRFIGEVAEEGPRELPARVPPTPEDATISKIVPPLIEVVPAQPPSHKTWLKVVVVAALVVIAGAIYWITRPVLMPRVVGSHALTKTGYRKARGQARLVTDGSSIYFQEQRPSGAVTMQVGVNGGETLMLATSTATVGSLRDISRDGSALLLSMCDPATEKCDAWSQPLPTGPARLIVKDVTLPVWTPDGRAILFTRNDGHQLYRVNIDGSNEQRLAEFPLFAELSVSPDGDRVRVSVRPTRSLWEATIDGSSPHPIFSERKDGWSAGSWSPDERYYYFRSWDGERYNLWAAYEKPHWWERWLRKEVSEPIQLTSGPFTIGPPVVSKDGKRIYATASEPHGELSVWDSKSQNFIPYLGGISACYVDFSQDGQWIAYVSYPEGNLWRSKIDGSERMQLTAPPLAVINPRWSPDGKQIVFMDWSGGNRRTMGGDVSRIHVVSADGGAPLLLLAAEPSPTDPVWSPDGRTIAYALGGVGSWPVEIRLLDLNSMTSTKVPGSDRLWSPRWSPDGQHLVALSRGPRNAKLMLYSFATRKWEQLSSVSPRSYDWPSWSRDSSQVFASDSGLLVRIQTASGKKEQIADARAFRSTAYFMYNGGWFGLTPDGRPISMRDTAPEEIYAFDLEFK